MMCTISKERVSKEHSEHLISINVWLSVCIGRPQPILSKPVIIVSLVFVTENCIRLAHSCTRRSIFLQCAI